MKKRQKIKKIVSVLLTILMLQGIAVTSTVMTTSAYQVATAESQAQTQQINSNDSVYGSFRYTVSDNQVAITAYTGSESEVVIPSKIDDMPVTSIGNCAFHSCSVINVTIPNSVTSIGEGAFEVCVCLTSMTIPDSVTSIGHYAFAYCSNLTSVTIGNNVTNIGNGAFLECGLTSIDIPNSVTNIEDGAFWGCGRLIDITIGKNVKNIGASAFGYCSSLTDVEIANGVTSIGDYTFSDCSSLTSVTISNSVTKIGRYAFGYYDDGDMKKIDGFIINGEKNSKAESYAHNNGFTFVEFIPSKLIYCTITLSKTTYEYNGYSRKPDVTVKNGATTLTKDIDYTVVYKDNINAGTATVTIAGKDDYSGTVTETFVITKRPIKYTKVSLSQTSYDYDGTAIEPPVTVTYSGKVLMEGTDYIVSYENNITPGTANIVITGTGNCSGTKIIPFTILGDPIQNATIMLSQDTYTYNGYSRKPEVTVMLGTETLVKGTDYKVSYKDNINAGMATVVVTGINDYSGTVTENFMITTKLITQTKMTLSQTSYTYDGRAKTPAVTIMNGKKTLTENVDYTISYKNNINVGTAKVIVTGKGNYMGMLTKTFTIEN